MTKTKFVLTVYADTLKAAESIVEEQVASFLGIDSEKVSESVDVEFLVSTPEDSDEKPSKAKFEVTAYVAIKRSIAVNFGTHR